MLDTDLVKKAPLLVHLVFHPESASARALAKHIHVALNVDPVVQGLRWFMGVTRVPRDMLGSLPSWCARPDTGGEHHY